MAGNPKNEPDKFNRRVYSGSMNIEFRQHQLVVAGLQTQINILTERCVEHRKVLAETFAARESENKVHAAILRAQKDQHNADINAYEQRCEALETKIADLEAKRKSRKSK